MSDTRSVSQPDDQADGTVKGGSLPGRSASLVMAVFGSLTVAALITLSIPDDARPAGMTNEPAVDPVALSDIDAAVKTMPPNIAAIAAAQAKSCERPLMSVVLTNAPGTAPRLVQIRSGAYRSPFFVISDTPQRVAMPYPAVFAAGKGVISIDGAAPGSTITLYPTVTLGAPAPSTSINIQWRVKSPC